MEVLQEMDGDHFLVLSRVCLEQFAAADTSFSYLPSPKFSFKQIDSNNFHANLSCWLWELSKHSTMDVLCDSFTQVVQNSAELFIECPVFIHAMVGYSTCTSQAKKETSQVFQETQALP